MVRLIEKLSNIFLGHEVNLINPFPPHIVQLTSFSHEHSNCSVNSIISLVLQPLSCFNSPSQNLQSKVFEKTSSFRTVQAMINFFFRHRLNCLVYKLC